MSKSSTSIESPESELQTDENVIIQIGKRVFTVNKTTITTKMKFFQRMFMLVKTDNVIQLNDEIVEPDIFEKILKNTLVLPNMNFSPKHEFFTFEIQSFYEAAYYFEFNDLRDRIEAFMKNSIKIETVIIYKRIAVKFNLKLLNEECDEFILNSLQSKSKIKVNKYAYNLIPFLTYDELIDILQKLRAISRKEDMFYCAIEWVNGMENNRKTSLPELMKYIPLQALSFTFLKDVVSKCELIRHDKMCFQFLFDVIVNKPLLGEKIYAIGGKDRKFLSSVSEYNSTTGEWTATTPMPSPRIDFGCAVIEHRIYICGGWNEQRHMNELTVFDTLTRTWTQLTPMKHARSNCSAAVLNGQIYVAGGKNGTYRLAVVERYCVQTDRWEDVTPMTSKRAELELAALKGFLYAIGGHDGIDALNSVERYDPQTDQWTRMNNTNNNKHYSLSSAVLNGYIYIVGDHTCEVYSTADDKWTEMPVPNKWNGGKRLAVYDDKLYSIGGQVGHWEHWIGSKTVEVYDFQARVWRPEPDMDIARCFHAVAVLRN